jgi:hypothetical protein
MNEEFAEVLGGLKAGETVVLNPSSAIIDGKRVSSR